MRRGLTLASSRHSIAGIKCLWRQPCAKWMNWLSPVYPTDVIDVPLQVRAGWIRALYPKVRIIEA